MNCKQCPYIKAEYLYKADNAFDEYKDDIEDSCWCEKVGGKLSLYGRCGDPYIMNYQSENRAKRKRRNKRERDLKHKRRLKFIADNSSQYPCGAMYVCEKWTRKNGYTPLKKPYYKRLYRDNHSGNSKKLKSYASRCVRRYKGDLQNGGSYKKVFDYWWELT